MCGAVQLLAELYIPGYVAPKLPISITNTYTFKVSAKEMRKAALLGMKTTSAFVFKIKQIVFLDTLIQKIFF